ncbi:Zn-ribbon domain-containing OB-fold protein [Comamonas humi]
MSDQDWMAQARALVGRQYGRIYAWDPVNRPMIRHWCELMGVEMRSNAEGRAIAPAAMLQVWCMAGPEANHHPEGSTTDNPFEVLGCLEAQGFAAVVAVNSEFSFARDVLEGERLYCTTRLESLSEQKTTALGVGYFVTAVMDYYALGEAGGADDPVGQQLFRVFKYRPAQQAKPVAASAGAPSLPVNPRAVPGLNDDNRFFWEGAQQGRLLIQRCQGCGDLHHPPGPVCPQCQSFEWDTVQASGRGTVYSYVVMHYPEVPPYEYPNPIGLIELEEGVRVVAQLVGVKPEQVCIGMPVQVEFNTFGELTLPQFRPVA